MSFPAGCRGLVEETVARLGGVSALVIGDLMLDEYVWGTSDRISPEAPVQVVDVCREDLRLGGAGNVVNNLVDFGCRVAVAGVVGDDPDGRMLRTLLSQKGVDTCSLLPVSGRTTPRKTRILASSQQMLRIDRESREPITAAQEAALLAGVAGRIASFNLLLLSDYRKGVLTPGLIQGLIRLGREHGLPVVIDPKGSDYARYRGATLLTPNRKEVQLAVGRTCDGSAELLEAAAELFTSLDLEALVLTRSEEGMSLFLPGDRIEHLPTQAREVFDVSGAGDTVLTFVGVGLACGLPVADAARLANLAAGVVVGKVGTSTVTVEELVEAAAQLHRDPDLKLHPPQYLRQLLDRRRARGERIAFTNGCFDLLHVGHVRYLQQARRLGDLLVLGLNSDASIRRLKGPKRPLIGEEERAHILAALDCIDYVVIFDEDTPEGLIQLVRPDILIKGGDYTPETVVGRDFVESYGGRVELIPFVDGKSTTNIINRILEQYRDGD